jgi:H+-translocating NAD(P) transhydrogenase subunit alpha
MTRPAAGKRIISSDSTGRIPVTFHVAVLKEVAPGEARVALTPEVVPRMVKAGYEVVVEAGAGEASRYLDAAYAQAGAMVTSDRAALLAGADVVVKVQIPTVDESAAMRPGVVVIALMNANRNLEKVAKMRDQRLTSFALDLLPRITRAQSMDVLSSQATVAGYRAALIGADLCPKFLPMLTTAAGTVRPAHVLILGAGVAGLMAIATSKRLGAIVEAYDVRRAAGEQVRSLGARFLELQIDAEGSGGYARELTDDEKKQEAEMLAKAVAEADIVITTANVPGRRAPLLVKKEMVARMRPGAVIIDLAAESGGNVELTKPGETVEVNGVRVVGPLNLPSQLPFHASQMFAKNVEAFLKLLVDPQGNLLTTFTDEILAASLLTRNGEVLHAPTRDALAGAK